MSSTGQLAEIVAELEKAPNVTKGPLLLKLIWIFLSISIIVVALRIWTKLQRANRLYYDDGFMVAATVAGITHAIIVTIAISKGFGRHIVHLTLPQIEETMKYGAFTLLFGWLSPMLGRVAFCCTIFYLTKTDSRVWIWPIWVFIALQVAINAVGIVLFYVQCGSQLDAFWVFQKQLHYSDYCWNPRIQTNYQYFMGSFNTLTDCSLAVIPAILIENTNLSRKAKTTLCFLLCLSVLAMASSVVKTYESKILSEATDYTYNLCSYVIWVSVELNVVIITASIPLLRPLFRRPRPSTSRDQPQTAPPGWRSHIALGSALSTKDGSRVDVHEQSMKSESVTSLDAIFDATVTTRGELGEGITITREVQVRYEKLDAPFLHAALVGLVQGEIANPKLART